VRVPLCMLVTIIRVGFGETVGRQAIRQRSHEVALALVWGKARIHKAARLTEYSMRLKSESYSSSLKS